MQIQRLRSVPKVMLVVLCIIFMDATTSLAEEHSQPSEPDVAANAPNEKNWWDEFFPSASITGGLGRVDLHGFGSWAFADTDGNPFLDGDGSGRFDTVEGGLVVTATAFDRLRIHTQASVETASGDSDISLERAFAEWTFTDWLKIRGGRSPYPIGIYSEVLNIGTTRPFFDLPQGVYGPVGISAEFYEGIGLTGTFEFNGWELSYDAYGGASKINVSVPYAASFIPPPPTPGSVFTVAETDLFGGRIQISPPIDGLTIGASASSSSVDGGAAGGSVDKAVYGAQLEFVRDRYSLRGEYYTLDSPNIESHFAYVMGTIRPFAFFDSGDIATILDRFELALLWNLATIDEFTVPTIRETTRHQEWAGGINFWFTPTFVARVEYHYIENNLLAHDGASLVNDLATGNLEDETQLIKAGLQFSF